MRLKSHPIQTHILTVLSKQKHARFRDLRPDLTDTNLCSYHLKILVNRGLVVKSDEGYTLSQKGMFELYDLSQVDASRQPNVATIFVIQNGEGDILLQRRTEQPYLDGWSLPQGIILSSDALLQDAVARVARSLAGSTPLRFDYAGDAYIRFISDKSVLSSTLFHVFRAYSDEIVETESRMWARPHKLTQYGVMPGTEEIMTRTFFRDAMFFEEFTIDL